MRESFPPWPKGSTCATSDSGRHLDVFTDRPPRKEILLTKFTESDQLRDLALPSDDRLRSSAISIESAMKDGSRPTVRHACGDFLSVAAEFYGVPRPNVRALASRPLRVREGGWATELFGDYSPSTGLIRMDAHRCPQACDLIRNIPQHSLPRILPPP